ncbi:MAG: PilZ domain-containing protein [Chloroflexi bacterium]|nr:PilZ domain-containing protein [Chloroflexota bacterium]
MQARQFQRIPASIPATVNLPYGNRSPVSCYNGEVQDVGARGLRILIRGTLGFKPTGAAVRIFVERSGKQPSLNITGTVVNLLAASESTEYIYLSFDRVFYEIIKDMPNHRHVTVQLAS